MLNLLCIPFIHTLKCNWLALMHKFSNIHILIIFLLNFPNIISQEESPLISCLFSFFVENLQRQEQERFNNWSF